MKSTARILVRCGLLVGGIQGCLAPNGAWDPAASGSATSGGSSGATATDSDPGSGTDSASSATEGGSDGADWWDPGWSARVQITWPDLSLPSTAFPLPVRLDPTRIDYNRVSGEGFDLRFVDTSAAIVPHEVETWDPQGESLVWVLVPAGTTSLTLYYDNPDATDSQDASSLWSGYHGVWHLAETGTGAPGEFADSTAGGHHGQGGGGDLTAVPTPTSGILGGAQHHDGGESGGQDVIVIEESSTFNFDTPAVTLEAWLRLDPAPRPPFGIMLGFSGYNAGYRIAASDSGGIVFQVTGIEYSLSADSEVMEETWHYVVGVYDGAQMQLYIDGELQPTAMPRTGPIDPATGPVRLGGESETLYAYAGSIDELRVSNAAVDATYVTAQYLAVTADVLQFSVQ